MAYTAFWVVGALTAWERRRGRWNGSMERSSAAPTSLASSPMKRPSIAWSAPSCLNRTTNGLSSGARYMTLETIAALSDDAAVSLPAMAD
jgi:hypothetical protein